MTSRFSHRSWFLTFLGSLSGLLACVAIFNLLVDSHGAFRKSRGLSQAARHLMNNTLVAGEFGRFEERELQRLVIRGYPHRRDIIAIGSSRSFLMRRRFIRKDTDFFNHSVTAAGIPDYITTIGMYREKGLLPRAVMLSVDPWVFNKNSGIGDWWHPLARYYDLVVAEIHGKRTRTSHVDISQYLQLINLEYTTTNAQQLRKGSRLVPVTNTNIDTFVREPDGSLHLPYSMRFARADKPVTAPANVIPLKFLQGFDHLSHVGLFEGLVEYLHANGVAVVFVLLPLNPHLYEHLRKSQEGRFILSVEDYLKDVAARYGITLIGSYDPYGYGFTGKDFFDAIHGHEIVARKIMAEYRW